MVKEAVRAYGRGCRVLVLILAALLASLVAGCGSFQPGAQPGAALTRRGFG